MPLMIVGPRTFFYFTFYEHEDSVLKEIALRREGYFIIKELQNINMLLYENLLWTAPLAYEVGGRRVLQFPYAFKCRG